MASIAAGNLTFEYESFGPADAPVILLVMGLGMQMIAWREPFCMALVERGFRVVRFDNRDVGLSTRLHHLGSPNIPAAVMRYLLHLPLHAPYRIDDMAFDTAALMEALGIERAHVVGASMGGMIAQNLAAHFPQKVLSLTSIMSTTGRRSLPGPQWTARRALLTPAAAYGDVEGAIARMKMVLHAIGSPGYPQDEALLHAFCEQHVRRGYYPPGTARQLMAIAASGDRSAIVRTITAPTLVIHGEEDPLVPLACGIDTARQISGARLLTIPGMGHDLPAPLYERLADAITEGKRAAAG